MKPAPPDSALHATLRVYGLIQRYMQPYFARHGITPSQWGVLRALLRFEAQGVGRVQLNELSRQLLIQPPSVTGVIDRLERMGLVSKAASRTDRRAREVAITRSGRQLVAGVMKEHQQRIARALKGLSAREQRELKRLLEKLGASLEAAVAEEGSLV